MADAVQQRREAPQGVQAAAPPAAALARLEPADDAASVFSDDSGYYSDASSASTFTELMSRYTISYAPEYSVKLRKGCVDRPKMISDADADGARFAP